MDSHPSAEEESKDFSSVSASVMKKDKALIEERKSIYTITEKSEDEAQVPLDIAARALYHNISSASVIVPRCSSSRLIEPTDEQEDQL